MEKVESLEEFTRRALLDFVHIVYEFHFNVVQYPLMIFLREGVSLEELLSYVEEAREQVGFALEALECLEEEIRNRLEKERG
jgi:hypothetical protein